MPTSATGGRRYSLLTSATGGRRYSLLTSATGGGRCSLLMSATGRVRYIVLDLRSLPLTTSRAGSASHRDGLFVGVDHLI